MFEMKVQPPVDLLYRVARSASRSCQRFMIRPLESRAAFHALFCMALFLLAAPRASAQSPNPGDPLFCQPQEGVVFLIVNGGSGVFTANADCYNNNINNDTTLSITTTQGGSLAGTRSGASINYVYTPPTPTFTGLDTFLIPVTTVWNGDGGTGLAGGTSRPGGPTTFTVTLNVLPATTTMTAYAGQAILVPVPAGSISNCVSAGSSGLGPKPSDILGCVKGIWSSGSPNHGSLVASGNTLKYTPTAGYSGSDTFTYQAYGINTDGNFALNSGNITVQVTVLPVSTTTLTVNNASSNAGDTITGSVTVSPSTATGTVNLQLDGSTATTCTLSSGSCSWSLEDVAAGTHSLVATYPGVTNVVGSSNSATKTLTVAAQAVSGDSRTVSEPSFPTVCQQLTAALLTNPSTQDLETSVDASDSNPDGGRIQAALDGCSSGSSGSSVAVELSMDSAGVNNAFLSGPLHIPSNVTLVVDPAVTLFFSRNAQDYDSVQGTHSCGTINLARANSSCLPMIDIPSTSTNVGIMGFGKLNGRGGDALLNSFATSGYAMPTSPTWWNLTQQANGEGNQQNPNFLQIEQGASNITLYKITLLNAPMAHIATTGQVTNLTVWDAKLISPFSAGSTDGLDAVNLQNATVTQSWISTGGDNVAVSAPGTAVPANNISITKNRFFAGSGAGIGSITSAGVSNVLFDKNMFAGNGFAGFGSAALTGAADLNSTAVRIKSANDRGGTVSAIQYSNSCFLDHAVDIQVTPYFYGGDSSSAFPVFTDITLNNLVFANDASGAGTVEFTGEYNSNGGNPITYPLRATLSNVTFPAALTSVVSSATPVYGASVWGTGNQSGGPGQNAALTIGPGAVSGNFLTAYSATVSGANNNTLTNSSSGSLTPPTCTYTYLAPELTGPNGLDQTITFGSSANLDVILTPAVSGAPNPSGTAIITDALTTNTFTGVFDGSSDTLIVPITASDLAVGAHTFSVTSYSGDSNYSVSGFGSTVVTVIPATPVVTEWPTASNINPGQTLASSVLTGGSASVPGTFAFTMLTTSPAIGTAAQSVTFTPSDAVDYVSVTGTVNVMVGRMTPTVTTWPAASSITYGQTLANSSLTGGVASVPGAFAFTTPATAPGAGTAAQSVTFTPTDTTNYTSVAGTASVTVTRATPTVTTWPAASSITYGQTLANSSLSGGVASVPGTFGFTTLATGPSAGTAAQSVTFTPADTTNYTSVAGTASVTVTRATPAVTTWPAASSITYGQTLANSSLSGGVASVPGTFAFTTPTIAPNVGSAAQSVTFTSTDATDYAIATGFVTLVVNKATPKVSVTSNANPALLQNAVTLTATVSSAVSTPTGSVTFLDGTAPVGTGAVNANGVATLTISTLAAGTHAISASYLGDNNLAAASSSALGQVVQDFTLTASTSSGSPSATSQTVLPGGTAVYTFTLSPVGSTTFPATVTMLAGGLPAGATYSFSPASVDAGSGSTQVTLTIQLPQVAAENLLPAARNAATPGEVAQKKPSSRLPFLALALLLLPLTGRIRRASRKLGRLLPLLLLLIGGLGGILSLSGCGSASGYFGHAPATYTVTVTGTAGALTHSTSVTLKVE